MKMKKNINHLSYHSLVLLFLQILAHWTSSRSHTVRSIMDCLHKDTDELSQWNYITATLFGFGVVTTLGKILSYVKERALTCFGYFQIFSSMI